MLSSQRSADPIRGFPRRRSHRARGVLIVGRVDRPIQRGLGRFLGGCRGGGAADMTALIAAAKAEGALTTIALPRDWCNYGAAIDGFSAKYGIKVTGLNPGGGSKDELAAITANKDNPGPAAPDVVDVGLAFGPQGVDQKLFQPYKVATWDTIPDSAKSADGMWYGDYFGVMSFEVNTKVVTNVPKDWPDLLKPDYKKSVALFGDPLASNQAQSAVWAAGLSSNGGNLDSVKEGLDFFKQLNDAGNFVPVIASTATVASGNTPIRLGWTYNGLADKDKLAGNPPISVVVPTSGRFGGMYVQAISAYAPHPNAAKLWRSTSTPTRARTSGWPATATRSAMTTWRRRTPSTRPRTRSCPSPRGRSCRPSHRSPPPRRRSPRAGRPWSASRSSSADSVDAERTVGR